LAKRKGSGETRSPQYRRADSVEVLVTTSESRERRPAEIGDELLHAVRILLDMLSAVLLERPVRRPDHLLRDLDLQLRRESREGGLGRRGRRREGAGEGGEVERAVLSSHRDSFTYPLVKQAGESERKEGEREEEEEAAFNASLDLEGCSSGA
jgi:hypothetical protein